MASSTPTAGSALRQPRQLLRQQLQLQQQWGVQWDSANVFRYCTGLKILGSFMVLVVLGVVGVSYYAVVCCTYGPMLLAAAGWPSLGALVVLALFHALLVMLLWCYFAAVFTDPGSVPDGWTPFASSYGVEASDAVDTPLNAGSHAGALLHLEGGDDIESQKKLVHQGDRDRGGRGGGGGAGGGGGGGVRGAGGRVGGSGNLQEPMGSVSVGKEGAGAPHSSTRQDERLLRSGSASDLRNTTDISARQASQQQQQQQQQQEHQGGWVVAGAGSGSLSSSASSDRLHGLRSSASINGGVGSIGDLAHHGIVGGGSASGGGGLVSDAGDGVQVRRCKKCLQFKPPRSHHCSVCGRCVLKMDHHCVWVVNCVGARNHKAFLLFMAYTFLENLVVSLALLPQFISFFARDIEGDAPDPGRLAAVFLAFVLNLAFTVSLLGFLAMHTSLVLSNTTTIEAFEKSKAGSRTKFDLGRRRNLEQVFGCDRRLWLVPMYSAEDLRRMPELHGLYYPCRPVADHHLHQHVRPQHVRSFEQL